MFKRIWALFIARNIEFYRDKSSLGWSMLFPFLFAAGFSMMFGAGKQNLYKAGIIQSEQVQTHEADKTNNKYKNLDYVDFVVFELNDNALDKLKHHHIDILINDQTGEYWVNDSSPKGYVVEKMLLSGDDGQKSNYIKRVVSGSQITYSEWLFPGIIGMNMMFSGLFGVGFVVVRYRKNGLLKRLSVTPMRAYEYLLAQILSRLFIMLVTTSIVYFSCVVLYGFQCRGSYLSLFIVFLAGAFSMISIGLLVAARITSEELAGGLLNLVSWPMMFLSGVWFSLEGSESWVKTLSNFFPLTHLIESARKIMNDGADIFDVRYQLLILVAMSFLFIIAGSILFEWQKE